MYKSISVFLGTSLLLASFALSIWKCRFGVELYDEALYIPPGFKLFLLGDQPYRDEVNNAPRQHDILNYFLVRPFQPYSLLALRLSATVLYGLLLAIYVWLAFGKSLGITAALTFAAYPTFDTMLVTTWSHNHWVRVSLLAHHLLLWLSRDQKRWLSPLSFLAGTCIGFATIAYNTLLPAPLIFIVIAFLFWNRRAALFYAVGFSVILIPLVTYAALHGDDVTRAFQSILAVADYSNNTRLEKGTQFLLHQITRPEFWLVVGLGLSSDTRWLAWIKPLRSFWWTGLAALGILVGYRVAIAPEFMGRALSTTVSIGTASLCLLTLKGWMDRDRLLLSLSVTSFVVVAMMGLSSGGGTGSPIWFLPAVAVLLLGELTQELTLVESTYKKWLHCGIIGLLLCTQRGVVYAKTRLSYHDVPPHECTEEIGIPPMNGIYTSPKRAALIREIAALVDKKAFVFTYPALPAAVYFGNIRSAVNTIYPEYQVPPWVQQQALEHMLKYSRQPELLIRVKQNAWVWGVFPLAALSPKRDPFQIFFECAQNEKLASHPEFDAYSVKLDEVSNCVRRANQPSG